MNNSPSVPPLFPVAEEGGQGYMPSQYSTTSTPSPRLQPQRARFGFHPPSPYPRPRSSASKPNPGPYFNAVREEPMSANYPSPNDFSYANPSSDYQQNQSQNSSFGNNSFNNYARNDSYESSRGGSYNEPNTSLSGSYKKPGFSGNRFSNTSFSSQDGDSSYTTCPDGSFTNYNQSNSYNQSPYNKSNDFNQSPYNKSDNFNQSPYNKSDNFNQSPYNKSDNLNQTPYNKANNFNQTSYNKSNDFNQTLYKLSNTSFEQPPYNQSNSGTATTQFSKKWGANSPPRGATRGGRRNFRGRSPARFGNSTRKFSPSGQMDAPTALENQTLPATRPMKRKAPPTQLNLGCEICGLNFTSQIPYEMHLNGAKHTKKMKAIETLKLLQAQGHAQPGDSENKIFECKVCNLQLNGALQVQTHFEGNKHKQKLKLLENPEQAEPEKQNGKQEAVPKQDQPTPTAEASMDTASPAKMMKLACDVCGVTVNSSVQLQQHLDSKKHLAKLEGKSWPARKGKGKKKKSEAGEETGEAETDVADDIPKVINIPDISTTFVKAENSGI